jgi:hypothetical protein
MSQPDRPKPFSPHGAVDGAVVDSALAKEMKIDMRYGNSCGIPFVAKEYFQKHIQWRNFEPYVFDRLTQPWSKFGITENLDSETGGKKVKNSRSRKFRLKKGGKKTRKGNKERL